MTIYRKYRPQKWADLTGQEPIKLTLEKEIASGQLAHAYLFSGARGIGKTTVARLIAKSLNCLERKDGASEPCNSCVSCQEITANNSLDVLEIDAASHTGVDNVRENIVDSVRFMPAKSKYKIFIIDEAHMLSLASFNALLKTLEEPPAHIIFILATTELHKIPATIISRCQNFDFKKVSAGDIKKRLTVIAKSEGFEIEDQVLARIAAAAQGSLRDAESLLGQLFSLGAKTITAEEAGLILPRYNFGEIAGLVKLLSAKNLAEALTYLNGLVDQGLDLVNFSNNLVEFLRLVLHYKISGQVVAASLDLDEALLGEIAAVAKNLSLEKIIQMMEIFIKQKANLRLTNIPQLPLELALVSICTPATPNVSSAVIPSPVEGSHRSTVQDPSATLRSAQDDAVSLLTLDLIKEKWQAYLNKVRDYNHSLPFILKMSQPLEINGQVLKISLKYSFHCEKLNEPKTKQLAEKALNDVYGAGLFIEPVLIEGIDEAGVKASPTDSLVANLAQAFGGQVIE